MNKETTLAYRIEALRDKWSDYASGIEITHGNQDPAAKAFRQCIGDCHDALHTEPTTTNDEVKP